MVQVHLFEGAFYFQFPIDHYCISMVENSNQKNNCLYLDCHLLAILEDPLLVDHIDRLDNYSSVEAPLIEGDLLVVNKFLEDLLEKHFLDVGVNKIYLGHSGVYHLLVVYWIAILMKIMVVVVFVVRLNLTIPLEMTLEVNL